MGQSDRTLVNDATEELFGVKEAVAFLARQSGRKLTATGVVEFVDGIHAACLHFGVAFDIRFAQACVETDNGRYTGQVRIEQFNIGGIGATDDGAAGISNPDWATAGYVFVAHSLAWANDERGKASPRYHLVQEKAERTGFAGTFRDLGNGRWATDPIYGDTIDRRYAEIEGTKVMANGKETTDRHIKRLREMGFEISDNRGKLITNGIYRKMALSTIRVVIHHWTGDRFGKDTVDEIVGINLDLAHISENLTMEQEFLLVNWYAKLHARTNGWPGIAYPYMVMPSGRIHINHDIGTMTYHAYDVNGYSVATCCPNSNGQKPTQRQLEAINSIWWLLFEETPEIPAAWGDLWGHSEAKRFDSQNQTACPGPIYLDHVRRARASGKPTVEINVLGKGPVPVPPAPPPVTLDPVTGHYIVEELYQFYLELGGVEKVGRPLAGAVLYSDRYIRQPFERACLGYNPADNIPVLESVGTALMMQTGSAYPVWGGIVPLL